MCCFASRPCLCPSTCGFVRVVPPWATMSQFYGGGGGVAEGDYVLFLRRLDVDSMSPARPMLKSPCDYFQHSLRLVMDHTLLRVFRCFILRYDYDVTLSVFTRQTTSSFQKKQENARCPHLSFSSPILRAFLAHAWIAMIVLITYNNLVAAQQLLTNGARIFLLATQTLYLAAG